MPVVFILVDALRHDYLNYHKTAPFLSYCAANGVYIEQVQPSLGFCERIEILTGVGFPENGYFAAIGRHKGHISPYFVLKVCSGKWCENSLFKRGLNKVLRGINVEVQPYEIPFILPDLVLTEDATDHTQPGAFQIESIVDTFAEAGRKISWHFTALGLQTGSDDDRMQSFKKTFNRHDADLYFLYLGTLDVVAHHYGPLSTQVGIALRKIDAQISDLFEMMKKVDPTSILMVLGDHGMVGVKQTLDAGKLLQTVAHRLGLKLRKDYVYFLDSTACRIWGESQRFKENENMLLAQLEIVFSESGYWLEGEWNKALYGDHIWVCLEGVLVFPDFFHSNMRIPYKGMHGYRPESAAIKGLGLIYGGNGIIHQKTIPKGNLRDVANTLCTMCGVVKPKDSLGTSWIN